MTISEILTMLLAASLPIVVVVAVGRHLISASQSLRHRRFKFALFSVLAIVGILLVFAGVAVAWFAYGVSHSQKGLQGDLVLLAVSVALIYGGGYGLWRLARYMDENRQNQSPS